MKKKKKISNILTSRLFLCPNDFLPVEAKQSLLQNTSVDIFLKMTKEYQLKSSESKATIFKLCILLSLMKSLNLDLRFLTNINGSLDPLLIHYCNITLEDKKEDKKQARKMAYIAWAGST